MQNDYSSYTNSPKTNVISVCMPALVVAVLIAYDYECARKLSASLFLGSQKQAFLASWLWALIVCVYACSRSSCVDRI